MSYSFLRLFIPAYGVVFALVCFAWRIHVVYRRIGTYPVIVGNVNTPHGYVGRMLAYLVVLISATGIVYSFFPDAHGVLGLLPVSEPLQGIGIFLLLLALLEAAIAQAQMGESWRIGIETTQRTEIIHRGLYRYSRNPIYVGMYAAILGFFLLIPGFATLLILIIAHFSLQLLVRLEEAHLEKLHGDAFRQYCARVRRWL